MGLSVVIICKGEFPRKAYPRHLVKTADKIVCCDGALKTYLRVMDKIFDGEERLPDVVVGDLDSLPRSLQKKFQDKIVHYTEQDYNDMTKAFRYALGAYKDISEVHFIAATGMREDHTVGNLSLLMEYTRMFDLGDMKIDMVSDYSTSFAITDSCDLYLGKGREISLISTDNSLRIKSSGLVWKTDDVVFDNLWKATLNRTDSDVVHLEFNHSSMALVIVD